MNYQKLKQEFNELSEFKQWEFAIHNKADIIIYLDNDNTTFSFDEDLDCTLLVFKADIGNRSGVAALLRLLGINSKSV